MIYDIINNVNDTLDQEQINIVCEKLWDIEKEIAIKLFFFICDKDQGKNQSGAFVKMMVWLHTNHRDTFYKNFSLIVGVPNSKIDIDPESILGDNHSKHEEILGYFIDPEYRESFRKNWRETARHELLKAYKLPEYGTVDTLQKVSEAIDDKKLRYMTQTVISKYVRSSPRHSSFVERYRFVVV